MPTNCAACSSRPTTTIWAIARRSRGQGARMANAIAAITRVATVIRQKRMLSPDACLTASVPTMKPLDQIGTMAALPSRSLEAEAWRPADSLISSAFHTRDRLLNVSDPADVR